MADDFNELGLLPEMSEDEMMRRVSAATPSANTNACINAIWKKRKLQVVRKVDTNRDGRIDLNEVWAAIWEYYRGQISYDDVIAVIYAWYYGCRFPPRLLG